MKPAILQYKFNTPLSDFMADDYDFNHSKNGNFIIENIKNADLTHTGFYYGAVDHPTEDETISAEFFIDLIIDFENSQLVDNYR